MQKIDRIQSDYAGRSRSCTYANLIWTVATSPDTSLDIIGQTDQALTTLNSNLESLGSDKTHIISVHVLLAKMSDKNLVDEIWSQWIGEDPQNWPQRACYGVDLGGKLLIEILVTAARGSADDS